MNVKVVAWKCVLRKTCAGTVAPTCQHIGRNRRIIGAAKRGNRAGHRACVAVFIGLKHCHICPQDWQENTAIFWDGAAHAGKFLTIDDEGNMILKADETVFSLPIAKVVEDLPE